MAAAVCNPLNPLPQPAQKAGWNVDLDLRHPLPNPIADNVGDAPDKTNRASKVAFSWYAAAAFFSVTALAMYFSEYKITVTILLSSCIGVLAGLSGFNGNLSDGEQIKKMAELIKLIILAIAKAL
jgi:hypothetical protein